MRASNLRHLITITQQTQERGEHGQNIGCDVVLYENIHASVITLSGRELEFSHQISPTATHQVKTRYLCGVDETCTVVFDGRRFGIGAVLTGDKLNDQRKLGLTLLCTENKL